MVENHLADRHLANGHLAGRLVADRHFGRQAFGRQAFGQQAFGQQAFGQRAFGWQDLADWHLADRQLFDTTIIPFQGTLTEWRGYVQLVNLLVLAPISSFLHRKHYLPFFAKQATLMGRSIVLSLPLRSVFPALLFALQSIDKPVDKSVFPAESLIYSQFIDKHTPLMSRRNVCRSIVIRSEDAGPGGKLLEQNE